MTDTCRACPAPLLWAITKDGKRAPLNRDPSPEGNTLVFRSPELSEQRGLDPDTVHCRTFAGFALDELQAQGVPLRLSHFADCPARERFREG